MGHPGDTAAARPQNWLPLRLWQDLSGRRSVSYQGLGPVKGPQVLRV